MDFNDEFLGVFGGFLDDQSDFVAKSVQAVLQLYSRLPNPPESVVVITHSMGCKIIQSALINPNISNAVNTVIMLAAPVDRPVVNIDVYFEAFYRKIDEFWRGNRAEIYEVTNTTNNCCNFGYDVKGVVAKSDNAKSNNLKLKDLLLITIGGGDQDLLVQSDLTSSKYSDIHAMVSVHTISVVTYGNLNTILVNIDSQRLAKYRPLVQCLVPAAGARYQSFSLQHNCASQRTRFNVRTRFSIGQTD